MNMHTPTYLPTGGGVALLKVGGMGSRTSNLLENLDSRDPITGGWVVGEPYIYQVSSV